MYLKVGYVKIPEKLIKSIKQNNDGTALLHTKIVMKNGKNECWVIDGNAKIIKKNGVCIFKLAEAKPCVK